MTEPEHVDAFEQALLASAKGDGMRADRKAAMALALGAGGGVAAAGAAATAKAAGVASAAATKVKVAASLVVMKWLAVAALGGAVVVGAVGATTGGKPTERANVNNPDRAPRAQPVAPPMPRAFPAPVETGAPPPDAPGKAPASAPAARPKAVALEADVTPPSEAQAPVAPRPPSLADEQRTIERARVALAAGDVTGAGRALDEHDATFPSGAFAAEAELLRIDALARSGEHERAARAARAALALSPSSPYAARLHAIAAEAPAAP